MLGNDKARGFKLTLSSALGWAPRVVTEGRKGISPPWRQAMFKSRPDSDVVATCTTGDENRLWLLPRGKHKKQHARPIPFEKLGREEWDGIVLMIVLNRGCGDCNKADFGNYLCPLLNFGSTVGTVDGCSRPKTVASLRVVVRVCRMNSSRGDPDPVRDTTTHQLCVELVHKDSGTQGKSISSSYRSQSPPQQRWCLKDI